MSAKLTHAQLERDPSILEDQDALKNILASIIKTYPSIYSIYVGLPNDNYYQIRRENDPLKNEKSQEIFWRRIEDNQQTTTSFKTGKSKEWQQVEVKVWQKESIRKHSISGMIISN